MKILSFQKKLKNIRGATNTSVNDLCKYVDITRQTLRNIEELKYNASEELLLKFIDYYQYKSKRDLKVKYWFNEFISKIDIEEEIAMRLKDIEKKLERIEESNIWDDIEIKIKEKRGARIRYAKVLFKSILYGGKQIVDSLKNDNIEVVKRYLLKPLIEDYINLKNIRYYEKDYVKAMNINNLREVLQTQNIKYYADVYSQLGESVYKFDKCKIKEKQEQKWDKISDEYLKGKMTSENNEIKFTLTFGERLDLYEKYEEDDELLKRKFIEGLYDYVNNYSHLNLYYLRRIETDDGKFIDKISDFTDKVISESVKDIGKIFRIKDKYLNNLYTNDYEEEYFFTDYEDEFSWCDGEEDDEIQEDN